MTAPPISPRRLECLDALRGAAALWVVLYHLWFTMNPAKSEPTAWTGDEVWYDYVTFVLFGYGYFGVTLFFVLSGFCIHLPQARRGTQEELAVVPFLKRRFLRLYPAYFASLVVAAAGFGVMRLTWSSPEIWASPWTASFLWDMFGGNYFLLNACFATPLHEDGFYLNAVIWTLVFEVQFYCLYPLLLACVRRIGLARVGICLLMAELAFSQLDAPWKYLFLARYFEWFLGVMAAEWYVRRGTIAPSPLAWAGLIVGFVAGAVSAFFPGVSHLRDIFVAAGSFFLLAILIRPGLSPGVFRLIWRGLIVVGLFSYSLYLIHLPLIRMLVAFNKSVLGGLGLSAELQRLLLAGELPLILACAYGFYYLFERPFLKQAEKLPSTVVETGSRLKLLPLPSRVQPVRQPQVAAPMSYSAMCTTPTN